MIEEFEETLLAKVQKSDLEGFARVLEALDEVTQIRLREEDKDG